MQKLEYLENERRFLDEIKSIFHNYIFKDYHMVENEPTQAFSTQACYLSKLTQHSLITTFVSKAPS